VGPTVEEYSSWTEVAPSRRCEGEWDTAIVAARLDTGSTVGKIFCSLPCDGRLTPEASRTPESDEWSGWVVGWPFLEELSGKSSFLLSSSARQESKCKIWTKSPQYAKLKTK
jgi:hypothetical protein